MPPTLPPALVNTTANETVALQVLYDGFANGPLMGGGDDAMHKLESLVNGTEEEISPTNVTCKFFSMVDFD